MASRQWDTHAYHHNHVASSLECPSPPKDMDKSSAEGFRAGKKGLGWRCQGQACLVFKQSWIPQGHVPTAPRLRVAWTQQGNVVKCLQSLQRGIIFAGLESISIIDASEKLNGEKKTFSAPQSSGDSVVTETNEHMCPSAILEVTG